MPAPVGRPSKYDPRYCQEMIDFCREGFSLTGYAGKIGVARETLTEWAEVHPEFSIAVKVAKSARTVSLEEDAARVRKQGAGPGTATMIIFGLKNFAPDEYADKIEQKNTGDPANPIVHRIESVIVHPADTNGGSVRTATGTE